MAGFHQEEVLILRSGCCQAFVDISEGYGYFLQFITCKKVGDYSEVVGRRLGGTLGCSSIAVAGRGCGSLGGTFLSLIHI